ncbi:MAG: hypothetical protein WAV83_07600 [Methanothrix sp.]|uniref:hypothetical protein n=1 Tax=Methanothrix sp. TaxID=90426 RepID=UPI003BB0DB30
MTCCCKCPLPAIIYQKYSGMHLCRAHFEDDIHRKAREILRQSGLFAHGLRLALLMDGGEGSAVMASIIKSLFGCRRDIDLIALIIDDRGPGLRAARVACQQLGLFSSIELLPAPPRNGGGRGDLLPDPSHPVQRARRAASLAQEGGADAMATGEDLDDVATGIFMSYLDGDIDGLRYRLPDAGQGMRQGRRGTIPIIQPLRRIPSREVRLYALQHGLCFCRERGKGEGIEEERQARAREELSLFDLRHPGTKYSLLRSLEKLGLRDLIDQGPPGAKPLSDGEKYLDPVPR